jgi:hypothetical protein
MTPGPSLAELIASVRAGAPGADSLTQLTEAVTTVTALEEVADATLAHFVDQCRREGRSWSEISKALGVTKQAAHKRFSFTPRLERFTPRARALLGYAAGEALRLGHNFVGTEHLLLGLFVDDQCLAARVLTEVDVTHGRVEAAVVQRMPRGTSTAETPPFTPKATACLEHTVTEALQLGHNYVGTEHILLVLFRDPEALAAQVLSELGATYDDTRTRVIEKLANLTKK